MLTSPRIAAALLWGACLLLSCGERPEPGPAPAASETTRGQELGSGKGSRLHRAGANGIPGRYIVVFEDSGAQALRASPLEVSKASEALVRSHGGAVRRVFSRALKGFSAHLSEAQALRLSEDPRVRYIEQDRVLTLHGTQSNATWGLDRVDQRELPLNTLYTYEYTGAGVHAYILDTGLRDTHTEFTGRVGNGFNAVADNQGIADCHGHGTHVAGTVGGTTYGVAKDVTIHPVRVIGCSGEGSMEELLAGIDWVSANHVKPAVANMSLGTSAIQALDDAVNQSIALGITYVVSAGNEGIDACANSPARTPPALTVGATDLFDQRAYWSNYGTCVDLFAPGDEITSAWYTGDTVTYDTSGTSMAAPHVAGAAALYLQGHPQATPAEVHDELIARSTRELVQDRGDGSPNVLLHSACMGSGDEVKPEVALTSPAEGALLTGPVLLSATASDDVAISKVEFYANGELLVADTAAPYEATWNSNTVANGSYTLSARAFDTGCNSQSASVTVSIENPGKATYDKDFQTPRCDGLASQCDSMQLLEGRGILGPEAHAPNTLFDSCADGNEGWYGFEPSIEQLKVIRDDGTLLAAGKRVRVEATFYAGFDAEIERLDLYSAPDATNPAWTYVATLRPADVGLNVLSTSYVLPLGSTQALRGVYRTGGTASACTSGNLNDHDDLVFTVVQETDTDPPTAAITEPLGGAVLQGTVKVSATASDNFAVTSVEFYSGSTLLATDTAEPYTFSWDTKTAPNGSHSLTARAYDATGLVGTSAAVSVTLNNDLTPPTVSITAPAQGATLTGSATISATASDNVKVTRVEFYVDDEKKATDTASPYSYSWDTRQSPNGPHTLKVVAFDAAGNAGTTTLAVTSENDFTAPTVQPTAPTEGATLEGTVTFTATASDDRAVTKVTFFVDDTQIGSDTTAPYSVSYNTRNKLNGPKVFTVKASDAANNVGTSVPVNVTFDNDFTPPTAQTTGPAEGATLEGTVTFTATASDERSGITKIVFYIDNVQIGSDSTAPYSLSYNTRSKTNGPKVFTAKAWDGVGNIGTSAPVNVTFDNDFTAPTVQLTAPTEGATLEGTITFTATASDERSGITKIVFYIDGSQVGTDSTAPYSLSYNTRNKTNGAKVLTAKAWDGMSNIGTSAPVNVTFNNDLTAPTTVLTSPASGSTLSGTVVLEATASDDRDVTRVDFYAGIKLLGSDTTAPYTFTWDTLTSSTGSYALKSRAYDAAGNNQYSASVSVTVTR